MDSFESTQAGMVTAMKVGIGIGVSVAFIMSLCACYIMCKVRKKWKKILKRQWFDGRVVASGGVPMMQGGVVGYTVPFQGTPVPVQVINTPGNNVLPMYAHPGAPVGYVNPGFPEGLPYSGYYPGNPGVAVSPEGFQPGMVPPGGFPPGVAAAGGGGYSTGMYMSSGVGYSPGLGGYNGGAGT